MILQLKQEKFASPKAKGNENEDPSRGEASDMGCMAGAVAFTIVGFSSLGWTLGSTAEKMAIQRAEAAVVAALAPICVAKFQHQADAPAKLVELNKVSSWNRRSVIEKGGWATMPGSDTPNSAVARVCAEKLGSLT
jgi:hypothetical protein